MLLFSRSIDLASQLFLDFRHPLTVHFDWGALGLGRPSSPASSSRYMSQQLADVRGAFVCRKPGLQFELRDVRVPGPVLSCFGWQPIAKVQQGPTSAGSWSPGGVLVASGSTDANIHLFDIRKRCDSPLVSLDVDKKTKSTLWYGGGSVLITSTAKNNSLCLSRLNL